MSLKCGPVWTMPWSWVHLHRHPGAPLYPGTLNSAQSFLMTSTHIQLWGLRQGPRPPLPSTQLPPGLGMLSLPPLPGLFQQPGGVGHRSASWVSSQGYTPTFAPRPGCALECTTTHLRWCAPHGSIFTWWILCKNTTFFHILILRALSYLLVTQCFLLKAGDNNSSARGPLHLT